MNGCFSDAIANETYEYWTLVESVRTKAGPRQRIVATLGKLPGMDVETRVGWEHIRGILDGRVREQDLLQQAPPEPPQWATVDPSRTRVERLRRFGEVYLGFPLAYEVFDGNRTDVTTVDEIVEMMREKYGHERRTWVMDCGMVSEDNLDMLRNSEAKYLVGTPKSMLKRFEQDLVEQDWKQVEAEVEVKLCVSPDGGNETFVLCRSRGRVEKKRAMREKQRVRLETELNKLKTRIEPAHRQQTRTTPRHPTAENGVALAQQTKVDLKCSADFLGKFPSFLGNMNFMSCNCGRWARKILGIAAPDRAGPWPGFGRTDQTGRHRIVMDVLAGLAIMAFIAYVAIPELGVPDWTVFYANREICVPGESLRSCCCPRRALWHGYSLLPLSGCVSILGHAPLDVKSTQRHPLFAARKAVAQGFATLCCRKALPNGLHMCDNLLQL